MFIHFALIMLFTNSNLINSSHFYGGSISSKPIKDNGENVTFNFTIRFSYRSSFSHQTFCDSTTISNRTLIGPNYKIFCVYGCKYHNTVIGDTQIYCLSYSKEIDWTFGSRTFSYTIPKVNKYQVEFYGSDWRSLVVFGYNRTGSSWELRHSIDSTNQSYSKKINSSPETLMSPVTSLPINDYHVIEIPYIDEDDDLVRCRWAEIQKQECKDICMAVPFGYLDQGECKLYLNTSQAQLGFYAAAIQIEDFKKDNLSHPISSVPLQFMIQIVEETNCTFNPSLSHSYPEKSCIAIDQKVNLKFVAKSECENVNITEIVILGAPGSIMNEMTYDFHEKKWSRSLSLNSSEHGHYLICARAVDSDFKSSAFSCLRVSTGVSPPYIIDSTVIPTGKLNASFEILNFSAEFSENIRKSNSSSSIKIFSTKSKELIYTLSSNNITFYENSSKIFFPVNMSLFSEGDFYVFFDYGVVVSTDFCNPVSEKIDDENFWKFSVEKLSYSSSNFKTTDTMITSYNFTVSETVYLSESLLSQNQNLSEEVKLKNEVEDDCNPQTNSLLFILISSILALLHNLILIIVIKYLKKND